MRLKVYETNRMRVVKRQWNMLKYLAAHRYATVVSISAEFGTCTKTIRRDVRALQDVGFPLQEITNADGPRFIRLDRGWLDLHGARS